MVSQIKIIGSSTFSNRLFGLRNKMCELMALCEGVDREQVAIPQQWPAMPNVLSYYNFLTHWGRGKWPPFSRRHFKCIFLYENVSISIKISLKFVPKVQINNIPALGLKMAWRRPGDKPLSEPRMESLLTHICVTRPQWVLMRCCCTDALGHAQFYQWWLIDCTK